MSQGDTVILGGASDKSSLGLWVILGQQLRP